MATAKLPSDQTVRTSTRLWSEEVAQANAEAPLPDKKDAYEFAGGRRIFKEDD